MKTTTDMQEQIEKMIDKTSLASVREAITELKRIIQATIVDLQSGRADYLQANYRLTCLQSNLRRLQAETVEL